MKIAANESEIVAIPKERKEVVFVCFCLIDLSQSIIFLEGTLNVLEVTLNIVLHELF
ncbi:MAG: hypothetical protein AAGA60_02270 [Cyanobacteria bacterium P01_E01_bin.42]